MEKMKMQSRDVVGSNVEKIKALFPHCVTERRGETGELELAVDFEKLQLELSNDIIGEGEERYQFTWPDKKKAIREANVRTTSTLRPCRAESVDFDTTENLYIEGDNLEVLKVIRETYLGKVKVIYIDPPYNTGNNIIYKNDFSKSVAEYNAQSNFADIDGNRLVVNTDSNGRFHTDWLNMIYPSLKVARDVLRQDGIIFIAIDDNEVYNLKKVSDEIFGESNYIGTIVTRCNPQGRNKNNIDPVHEYHLVYSKSFVDMPLLRIKKKNQGGDIQYGYLMRSGTNSRKYERPYRFYPILEKNGKISMIEQNEYESIYNPSEGFNEDFILKLTEKYQGLGYRVIYPISRDGEEKVWQRVFERVKEECHSYIYHNGQVKVPAETDRTPMSLWSEEIYSNVAYGTNKLKALFDDKAPFDFSKSIHTVMDLISLNSNANDIIMDFFPGSATTAHAVMKLNSEDGNKRKFIMIQLPEKTDPKSDAYKAEYKTICDVGKERIRRAGIEIKNNADCENVDTGFRVLKLDSSNMEDVYYTPESFDASKLFVDNVKVDRTSEDLLFQVMLELGVELSAKIESKKVAGKEVYFVDDNYLIACFDTDVNEAAITEIAKMNPVYFVMRDSSMSSDNVADNFDQIFQHYSKDTVRRIL